MKRVVLPLLALLPLVGQIPAHCQTNTTQGHGQLTGGNGRFGTTYTLKNDWNFAVYGGHYSLEPFYSYSMFYPKTDEKVFVLDVGFKNPTNDDLAINPDGVFTAVDSAGKLYPSSNLTQDSQGRKGWVGNLHPGQGLGQPELKDGVHVGWELPANARIVKILINSGRKFAKPDEDIYRYYIAGATKAEAGADGDPKNVVTALPANVADPADPSGAIALSEGKTEIGTYVPSGGFHIKVNSIASSTDAINGAAPDAGKKFVILNMTAKEIVDFNLGAGDLTGGDFPGWLMADVDGDTYKPTYYYKARADEFVDHTFALGDEYNFRVIFAVPTNETFKKVVIAAADGRKWALDGALVK